MVMTMIVILMALVGSYHFYNKGVGKSQSQALSQGVQTFSAGDVFAYTLISRVSNIIRNNNATCHDGSTDPILGKIHRLTKSFPNYTDLEHKHGRLNDEGLEWKKADDDGSGHCLASPEELRYIDRFRVKILTNSEAACQLSVSLEVTGRAKLPFQGATMKTSFNASKGLIVSPASRSDFGIIFKHKSGAQHITIPNDSTTVSFNLPVFIAVNNSKGELMINNVISLEETTPNVTFEGDISSNASSVNFSRFQGESTANFGVFMRTFLSGIRIKSIDHQKSKKLTEPLGFAYADRCDASSPSESSTKTITLDDHNRKACAFGDVDSLTINIETQDDTSLHAAITAREITIKGKGEGDFTIKYLNQRDGGAFYLNLMNQESSQNNPLEIHHEFISTLLRFNSTTVKNSFDCESVMNPDSPGDTPPKGQVKYHPNTLYYVR